MQKDLKPCPYCGNTEIYVNDYQHYCYCIVCYMAGPRVACDEEAIEAWNSLQRKPCKECLWLAKKLRVAYACHILGTYNEDIDKEVMKAIADERGIQFLLNRAKEATCK